MSWTFTVGSLAILLATVSVMFSFGKKWDPKGKHCYVTGGSQGLGLAVAKLLTRLGAHVSIVARDQGKLKIALAALEEHRQTPEQILASYSYSLTESETAAAALDAAAIPHGGLPPDALFLCAGASRPAFFIDEDERSLRSGMNNAYWVQALTALAAVKRMKGGKIVFVSSVLGYMSLVGYSSYSPAKFALRGLAEALRSEFILYGIDVHIFFPGTMFSPGYVEENKTKPKITLKIEETDDGITPERAADALLKGVQKGSFHIGSDLLSDIFRTSTRGATPYNNVIMDTLYASIGWIGLPIWRRGVDSTVKKHREEHRKYLVAKEAL